MNPGSEAFRRVVEVLDRAAVDYVVVGSTAAAAWGVIRSTRDVDLVMALTPAGSGLVDELMADDLYVPVEFARSALAEGGSFNVLHPTTGGKVDVFVCATSDRFEAARLARRVRMEVFGVDTWVATPEDIVLSKLRWRLESRSEIQWRDCVELAAIHSLDRAYLHQWAGVLGVADDLTALLALVDEQR